MNIKFIHFKRSFYLAFAILALLFEVDCSQAQEVAIRITINEKTPGEYENFIPYTNLFINEGKGYKSAGKRIAIGLDGIVKINLPDRGQWALSVYPPGALTPIYSPPLTSGRQDWDIKVAEVIISSDEASAIEGKEAFLYMKKGNVLTSQWKRAKITDGRFMLPLSEAAGEFYAGVKAGSEIRYSNALKQGPQTWDMGKNRVPFLAGLSDATVEEGGRLLVALSAWDIDGDPVRLGIEKQPGFTVFRDWGDNTGALVIKPGTGDAGIYKIKPFASDGRDTSRGEFVITVKKQTQSGYELISEKKTRMTDNIPVLPRSQLTAVWVNEGGDKVTRDELRSSLGKDVKNSVWDGHSIRLFGARNEVVSFNMILEAARRQAGDVSVEFNRLEGPGNAVIASKRGEKGVFDYRGRNIEIFLVRYLQIKGVSRLGYEPTYDERHVPRRLQLPYTMPKGTSRGVFSQRQDASKYYPDIAVPIEAVGDFNISRGENQGIWVDIYIPKNSRAGTYLGKVSIRESGKKTVDVPVSLEVMPFTLPDTPSVKTMVYLSGENINDRYFGKKWLDPSRENAERM